MDTPLFIIDELIDLSVLGKGNFFMHQQHSLKKKQFWSWLFLYALSLLFVAIYFDELYGFCVALSYHEDPVYLQGQMYWLLVPLMIPICHGLVVWKNSAKKLQASLEKLLPILLLGSLALLLSTGIAIEYWQMQSLESNGYRECISDRKQGLRSSRRIYHWRLIQ